MVWLSQQAGRSPPAPERREMERLFPCSQSFISV